MAQYTVELNYTTSITLTVEADDEGAALQAARDIAEQAPMSNFVIAEEQNSRILDVQ